MNMPIYETRPKRPATDADVAQTVWDIAEALGHLLRLSASSLQGVDSSPLRSVVSRMENRAGEIGRGDLASVLAEAHRRLRAESS
jgi:hypothetical protein